jgi:hypothetical protein
MKKIKPHSSLAFSLLVTPALKVCRFVDLLTEAEIALSIRSQTQAPAAECAPSHGGAPLDFRNSESRIRGVPFHFANGRSGYSAPRRGRPRGTAKANRSHSA